MHTHISPADLHCGQYCLIYAHVLAWVAQITYQTIDKEVLTLNFT